MILETFEKLILLRLRSYGMWGGVDWFTDDSISEEPAAFSPG